MNMADEAAQTARCANCGQPVPPAAKVCPHCGADSTAARVWPPPPEGAGPAHADASDDGSRREVKRGVGVGCGSGCLASVLALPLFGLLVHLLATWSVPPVLLQLLAAAPPFLVLGTLYGVNRGTKPFFARGVGYSLVIALALRLGALAVCHR